MLDWNCNIYLNKSGRTVVFGMDKECFGRASMLASRKWSKLKKLLTNSRSSSNSIHRHRF